MVSGINDNGVIVGFYFDAPTIVHGFIGKPGAFADLRFPGFNFNFPTAINNAGVVVGNYYDPSNIEHGYVFKNGVFTTFDAPGPKGTYTFLAGINNRGQIVGETFDVAGNEGNFVESGGSFTNVFGIPHGINDSGAILVNDNHGYGVLYPNGELANINYTSPVTDETESGFNNAGTIVGGAYILMPVPEPRPMLLMAVALLGLSVVSCSRKS